MHASEALKKFAEMSLEEALETTTPFGKHKGKKVAELPFGYAEWVQENITAVYADEEKFKFLYAISTVLESEYCYLPEDYNQPLSECLKKERERQ